MTYVVALARGLDRVLDAAQWLARVATIVGGAAILLSAFMIAADVVMRRVLGLSTWGADELSYYALAISTSWAFAYAMLVKAHIRIDMISSRFNLRWRSLFNIIALLGMGFFALAACQAILHDVQRAWRRGATSITVLETPLWIPQGLWLAGFVFFAASVFLLLLRVIVALLLERDFETAERYGGPVSLEEEITTVAGRPEGGN
jgi:TRAP-type mannitol/chloroaromatic compound transport system permease small subunit